MLDLTAIAQSTPGPVAVNAAILVGYHAAGIPGAVSAVFGTIIPPLFIISIISMFYNFFRDNRYVNMAMAGMLCGVAAVVLNVVIDMLGVLFKAGKKDKDEKRKVITVDSVMAAIMLVCAFIANRYLKINIIFIILAGAVVGVISYFIKGRRKGDKDESIS